jgi:thiamine-monophosphate kinase
MTGEFTLIAQLGRYLAPAGGPVLLGHGDDAAVVDLQGGAAVLAVDALVEGRHWLAAVSSFEDVGWKAVAVNCSDLAAMGASPVAAVVALHRPDRVTAAQVEALYRGMAEAAGVYGTALVGGDTVASDTLAVSVTVLGRVEAGREVRRAGARPGDALVCVGGLGAAAAGLGEATAGATPDPGRADPRLLQAHRRPRALLAAGHALAEAGATAMIDVSDGLGADIAHICRASGVSAELRLDDLPVADGVLAAADRLGIDRVTAVAGGEDYALVAALPPERAEEAVAGAAAAEGVPGAVVGRIVDPARRPLVGLVTASGVVDLSGRGYDHYAQQGDAGATPP